MSGDLWGTLLPLVVGSAVVPVQITVTILLLRGSFGAAAAWVGGMTAARLVQGVLFGLVFVEAGSESENSGDPGRTMSMVLLVVAVLFLTMALKATLGGGDDDAPPPKWMKLTASVTPGKALLFGAGYVAIAVKLWVFTLGAIGAIGEAALGWATSIAVFLLFVVLAEVFLIAVVVFAALAPTSSEALLERMSTWLERHNRVIVVALGLVFGTWFLVKALSGLGVV